MMNARFSCSYGLRPFLFGLLSIRHAGHNKWSKVHRTKAIMDSRKAVQITKIGHEIIAAVRGLVIPFDLRFT